MDTETQSGKGSVTKFLAVRVCFFRPSAAVKEITPETGSENQKRLKKRKKKG